MAEHSILISMMKLTHSPTGSMVYEQMFNGQYHLKHNQTDPSVLYQITAMEKWPNKTE